MRRLIALGGFLAPLAGVLLAFLAPPANADPANADPCWDTRSLCNGHDFPGFNKGFGGLPAEVERCKKSGEGLMGDLLKVRQDPSLLEKEKQSHAVAYKSLLECYSEWLGFRCQHIDVPGIPGGGTDLEGRLCYFGTNTRPVKMACADYARFAVQQNNENVTYHCGFTGPRWDSNAANHENWCKVVDPAMPIEETDARYQQLAPCLANVKHVGPAPLAPEIHKRLDQFKLQQH